MYFDIKPKTEKKDLFGVEYALQVLLDAFHDSTTRMIAIKGLRRVGKTSLLNVALKEFGENTLKIDVRESPFDDKKEFLSFLIAKIKPKIESSFLEKLLQKIAGVKIAYQDISLEMLFSNEEKVTSFFESLNKHFEERKKTFILAFDEAQLLKRINFDYFLASIFDNYSQFKIILTGSEIGLLDKFLGKKEYDSPLFGRACLEVELKRLKPEETRAFLQEGFSQMHKEIAFEETREVLARLDGIIGWLTHYGWLRNKGISLDAALKSVEEEGKELTWREFTSFLEKRRAKVKYRKVLKLLAGGKNNWGEILLQLKKEKFSVVESQLHLYLAEMMDYSFIEKNEGGYFIIDPLLVKAVKEK